MLPLFPDVDNQTLSRNNSIRSQYRVPSSAAIEQYSVPPELNVEDAADIAEVQPTQSPASVNEGWREKTSGGQYSAGSGLSTDVHDKNIAKELIEKHTIEVVNLETKLQNDETNQIKEVLNKFEDKKTKAVEDEKEALSNLLNTVGEDRKMEMVAKSAQHLEGVLAAIEEEKMKTVENVIKKLVEERIVAKDVLLK